MLCDMQKLTLLFGFHITDGVTYSAVCFDSLHSFCTVILFIYFFQFGVLAFMGDSIKGMGCCHERHWVNGVKGFLQVKQNCFDRIDIRCAVAQLLARWAYY